MRVSLLLVLLVRGVLWCDAVCGVWRMKKCVYIQAPSVMCVCGVDAHPNCPML